MSSLQDFEAERIGVERNASRIYYALAVAGGLVMLALAWRIDTPIMRAWAFVAAGAMTFSSVVWLQATKYAAAGRQLNVARWFLYGDWTIAGMNLVALFFSELAPDEAKTVAYGVVHYWAIIGGGVAVVAALVGLGFMLMFSPDRAQHDLARQYNEKLHKRIKTMLDTERLPPDLLDQMDADANELLRHIVKGTGQRAVDYGRAISGERKPEPPAARPKETDLPDERGDRATILARLGELLPPPKSDNGNSPKS